jgi:hypothetical protein
MNISQFRDLLDVHGSDPARWPGPLQGAARQLLAVEAEAQAALAQAQRIDTLILAAGRRGEDAVAIDAAVSRASAKLFARPLPPQRRRGLLPWWPAELLNLDFAPAWPRIAALASIAAIGFALGLTDLGLAAGGGSGTVVAVASADADLGTLLFEPDLLAGARQ